MIKKVAVLISLFLISIPSQSQQYRQILNFEFEHVKLNGLLNMPEGIQAKGIVLIVHGSGKTDAVAQEWHADVRTAILKAGYATYMWDKMGCGKSGGIFDYNQSVQSSAAEVIAAIKTLKELRVPGFETIGLWGISRAGWINPIVINQYKDIKFWISVSGVDAQENFKYLLEQNLVIDGLPKDSVNLIVEEWQKGVVITHSGGTYETYLSATDNLRKNTFLNRFNNGHKITKADYYKYQESFMREKLDAETGLQVYIENFDTLLQNITIPVLAIFGEKDRNVDWRKTRSLYKRTIAKNTDLSIKTFPEGNHNLFKCKTGGFFEFQDHNLPWTRCDGFLETITNWLNELE